MLLRQVTKDDTSMHSRCVISDTTWRSFCKIKTREYIAPDESYLLESQENNLNMRNRVPRVTKAEHSLQLKSSRA